MGLFNAVMALSGMIDTDVIEDERLARHTSYRIGGKADLFVTCHSLSLIHISEPTRPY